jgi:hypothetical protein
MTIKHFNRFEQKLKELAIASFQDTVKELKEPLEESITSTIWEWPRETKRQSGEIVFTPRNIVDTGQLKDSQQLFFESWTYAIWRWDTEYALYVHEGYTTQSGTDMPARQWVTNTLDNINIKAIFTDNLKKYL